VQKLFISTLEKAGPGSRAVAIIDNYTIIGPVHQLAPAVEHLITTVPEGGGRIKREKSKLHLPRSASAKDAQWAVDQGFKICTGAEDYLGGILGTSVSLRKARAMERAQAIAADMRKLDNPHLPVQIALQLMFACIPSRFAALARLCPPEILREAAQYLDQQMVSFYCKLAGISEEEINPQLRRYIFAARAAGGRGLMSCEQLLERSYLGSQALCASHLKVQVAAELPTSERLRAVSGALEQIKRTISESLADELLPSSAGSFASHFAEESKERRKEARELQHQLTTGATLQLDEKLAAEATTTTAKALRHCNRARGAGLAFTTAPRGRHLALTKQEVVINERLHAGLGPERRLPLHCHCGQPNGQYASDPWHALSCISEKGTTQTARHDDVKYALAHWCTKLGAQVKIEPKGRRYLEEQQSAEQARAADRHRARGRGRRRRAERDEAEDEKKGGQARSRPNVDLEITGLGGSPILVDVRVSHALAPSRVEQCARDETAVLKAAEAEKHAAYRELADKMGARFFAFAVESTGRLGDDAMAFIKLLISEGARYKHVWAPREVVHGIYRAVAVAIARGNANIVDTNLRRSRLAEWE
jgi:hypothetical protein